jgi:hypothetical protein
LLNIYVGQLLNLTFLFLSIFMEKKCYKINNPNNNP